MLFSTFYRSYDFLSFMINGKGKILFARVATGSLRLPNISANQPAKYKWFLRYF